jgi:hypothetical protein
MKVEEIEVVHKTLKDVLVRAKDRR